MKDADFSLQANGVGTGGYSRGVPQPPAAAAPASTGPKIRGYLLTLHVTTPNAGGDDYIRKTVIEKLRQAVTRVTPPRTASLGRWWRFPTR